MPVMPKVSYPGVYVQEVESDVHTIAAVDTSTTAFIGRALRGPVNKPTVINNFGDFERIFGGLWRESSLGFAVQQFFSNDGSKAVIVRVDKSAINARIPSSKATAIPNGLPLVAKDPGAWGSRLKAEATDPDPKIADLLAMKYALKKEDLFNLKVTDEGTGRTEYFADLSILPNGQRRVDKVLENESNLVAYDGSLESGTPTAGKSKGEAPKASDGNELDAADVIGSQATKTGIYALEGADIFNLLVIPPYKKGQSVETSVLSEAATYCQKRRALLLIDPPDTWTDKDKAKDNFPISGLSSDNAAVYFPNVLIPNRLSDNQIEAFGPSGVIAGVIARTDATRGVWKAPAGTNATLIGVVGLKVPLTDAENGELNPLGINCLRQMPAAGFVAWGARTIQGDDRLASQWKYIPVRRTALFIEESLYRGTQWAVFEPNDEPLWAQLRLNIGVFMHNLFRQGAFQGASPQEAYFVKCDKTTTTQADIDSGIVNVWVGFAPLKPAEFVILYIKQIAGQLAV